MNWLLIYTYDYSIFYLTISSLLFSRHREVTMQSTTRVALDAMGGDNAPAEVVKGAGRCG